MSDVAFEEAIARVMFGSDEPMPEVCLLDAADILAMPEMQAIRAWLRSDAMNWCCAECRNAALAVNGVPQSVIDWVLEP